MQVDGREVASDLATATPHTTNTTTTATTTTPAKDTEARTEANLDLTAGDAGRKGADDTSVEMDQTQTHTTASPLNAPSDAATPSPSDPPSTTDPTAADATQVTSATTRSPLAELPPELIDVILDHVPPEEQQRTALAIHRVLPHHPISNSHLWSHVVVHQPRQLVPLYYKLKEEAKSENGGATTAVRTFSQVCISAGVVCAAVVTSLFGD